MNKKDIKYKNFYFLILYSFFLKSKYKIVKGVRLKKYTSFLIFCSTYFKAQCIHRQLHNHQGKH